MLARGDRSLRQFSKEAGVSFTTVNKIENGVYKPSPKMIQKLMSPEAKPQNGITYEEVMSAAGFKTSKDEEVVAEAAHEIAEQIVDEKFKEESDGEDTAKGKASVLEERQPEPDRVNYDLIRYRRMQLTNIAKGVVFNAISQRGMVFTNLQDEDRPWHNDYELRLAIDKGKIKNWKFDFRAISAENSRYIHINESFVFGRVFLQPVDESMKLSFVTNNPYFFARLAKREHMIPYRGESSVILVNLEKMIIEKEVYLSNYYENDYSSEIYLA